MTKSLTTALAAAAIVAASVFFWWATQQHKPDTASEVAVSDEDAEAERTTGGDAPETSMVESPETSPDVSPETRTTDAAASDDASGTEAPLPPPADEVTMLAGDPWSAAAAVGGAGWSDADYRAALERLQSDPEFMRAIEEEFRNETDIDRIRRLSQLLGDVGITEVTDIAESLLYSGSDEARFAAMDLLRRQQQIDPRVRDIALDLLSYTSDESQLVSAMNILAHPGVALPEQQQAIVAQLTALASNPSAEVRRQSLSVLGRWAEDDTSSDVFANGLRDSDRSVRESAAYALVDYPYDNPTIKAALWSIITDADRPRPEIDAALLAYLSMPLSDAERQQGEDMRRQLQRR